MIRLNNPNCMICGKAITNELVLIPNGLSTGYAVFDSLECLKAYASKYGLDNINYCDNDLVDLLIREVKKKPKWSIKTELCYPFVAAHIHSWLSLLLRYSLICSSVVVTSPSTHL